MSRLVTLFLSVVFLTSCSMRPILHFFEEVIEEDLKETHQFEKKI